MMSMKLLCAAAAMALVSTGCAMPERNVQPQRAPAASDVSRPANTPAMTPDRVNPDRPRSFSDPGPNYPDTGR